MRSSPVSCNCSQRPVAFDPRRPPGLLFPQALLIGHLVVLLVPPEGELCRDGPTHLPCELGSHRGSPAQAPGPPPLLPVFLVPPSHLLRASLFQVSLFQTSLFQASQSWSRRGSSGKPA